MINHIWDSKTSVVQAAVVRERVDTLPEPTLRIAQVIAPSKVAGAERSTLQLCHELVRRGHTVWLICKAGHVLNDIARGEGLGVHPMRIGGKLNLAAPVRLGEFVKRNRVDVIATQLSTASLWGSVAGRALGVPVVATVRALNTNTCYMLANRIIAVSRAVRDHLVAQGTPEERIDVVYNGIDLEWFQPTSDLAAAKQAIGIDVERVVFGVVAHLTRKKGHSWFLQSAAKLHEKHPETQFVLLGDGVERKNLQEQARQLKLAEHVRFAGFQQDVRPWIAAMDVVVLPCIAKEGFGRVLVEAGAMAKPVITSQVGGVTEVVDDGKTGLIVPTGDVAGLAEAMKRLTVDAATRQAMGVAGRRRAERCFTVQRTAANTERVYRQLVDAVQPPLSRAA